MSLSLSCLGGGTLEVFSSNPLIFQRRKLKLRGEVIRLRSCSELMVHLALSMAAALKLVFFLPLGGRSGLWGRAGGDKT